MVEIIDIPRTILDIGDIKIPRGYKGKNLLKIAEGKEKRDEIFIQISEYMVGRAIRTKRWKYCVIAPDKDGVKDSFSDKYVEYQLYDLYSDPFEIVNLAGRFEYKRISEVLSDRLIKKIKEVEGMDVEIKEARFYP